MRFFFRKNEKLTSEKEIDHLFYKGRSSFLYPVKMIYVVNDQESSGCKVLVTVSKKNLRNATDRNLIKRRLREAYRLNSNKLKELLDEKKIGISLALIFSSSKIIPYNRIEELVQKHILNLINNIEKYGKREE